MILNAQKDTYKWLKSSEFEISQNSLYPPLINPQTTNYAKLDSNILYDINARIPQVYKYVIFAFGGTAHGTIINFLESSLNLSIESCAYHNFNREKLYNTQLKDIFVYYRWQLPYDKSDYKFMYLASHLPFIIIVRDPISRLRHAINHGGQKGESPYFNLLDDPKIVLDRVNYYDYMSGTIYKKPPQIAIKGCVKMATCFNYDYDTIANICQNNVYYMDMSEFMPNKILESLPKYAKFFGKNISKEYIEKNKNSLKEMKNTVLRYCIPLVMNISHLDSNLQVHITYKYQVMETCKDFSHELCPKNIEILDTIAFSMSENDFKILKENKKLYATTREYLVIFAQELQHFKTKHLSERLSENDLLNYFKTHKNIALMLKNTLDKELAHIKKVRPDIVKSWKYYSEFEKICNNL